MQVRGQFVTRVLSNTPLCREHFRLTLLSKHFPKSDPGQFIQIACIDPDNKGFIEHDFEWSAEKPIALEGIELLDRTTTLRRPFSIAGRRDTNDGAEIDIIGRDVGTGTKWMSQLSPGDLVNVIGPLGNAFAIPESDGIALMVGGGVGIPPMIYLAEKLARENRRGVAFCGATMIDLLALTVADRSYRATSAIPRRDVAEFDQYGVPSIITTDDGSYGFKGFVTQALEQYIDQSLANASDRSKAIVYTCGPEIMMKRVADIAQSRRITCQICVERAMACGMGTCQSCCIKVVKEDPSLLPLAGSDWCYRLACTDGPVFESTKLRW